MKPSEHLRQWLEQEPGPWRIGQVRIEKLEEGYFLIHAEESKPGPASRDLSGIREIVRTSAEGRFRPLKAEPNLRDGWRFGPFTLPELLVALDAFYPTAVANWNEWLEKRLRVTPFMETAGRQTGMYAVVKTLSPGQVQEVQQDLCEPRCLKIRLWSGQRPSPEPNEIPHLCPECCSLFISTCRAKLKGGGGEEE